MDYEREMERPLDEEIKTLPMFHDTEQIGDDDLPF